MEPTPPALQGLGLWALERPDPVPGGQPPLSGRGRAGRRPGKRDGVHAQGWGPVLTPQPCGPGDRPHSAVPPEAQNPPLMHARRAAQAAPTQTWGAVMGSPDGTRTETVSAKGHRSREAASLCPGEAFSTRGLRPHLKPKATGARGQPACDRARPSPLRACAPT